MVLFTEMVLQTESIKYIRHYLSQGNALSKTLAQNIQFEHGSVTTYLPVHVSFTQAHDFIAGGKIPSEQDLRESTTGELRVERINSANEYLIAQIYQFLTQNKDGICVFEDILSKPSDPYISSLDTSIVFYQDEVYFVLDSHETDETKIASAISYSTALGHFVCVMGSGIGDLNKYANRSNLTQDEFDTIIKSVERIVLGAYDEEGYLIWSR